MKIQTFEQLLSAYDFPDGTLAADDLASRSRLLEQSPFSLVAEGNYKEYEVLLEWIANNMGTGKIAKLFYGKTDDDYGYFEIFMQDRSDKSLLTLVIPNIFVEYPDTNIYRTDGGASQLVMYHPSMRDALIF